MKRVYRETFNQIVISETVINTIKNSARDLNNQSYKKNRGGVRRLTVAFSILVLITALAIPALAIEGFDFLGVFGQLFGDTAGIVQENGSLPEINMLVETFEDIDVTITGITGDESLIYIMLDVTKKDGGSFSTDQCRFGGARLELKQLNEIRTVGDNSESQNQGLEYFQATSDHWVLLQDDNSQDNNITLAYIVGQQTLINCETRYIPGETYILELNDFYDETTSFSSLGVWKGEFVADYKSPDKIMVDINQTAKMPDWGTSDSFSHEVAILNIELTPLALRYRCDYDGTNKVYDNGGWICLYLEMNDGSIIGDKTFDEFIQRLKSNHRRIMSGSGDTILNGEVVMENRTNWIFDKPINHHDVKAVHFGDLAIPIDQGNN